MELSGTPFTIDQFTPPLIIPGGYGNGGFFIKNLKFPERFLKHVNMIQNLIGETISSELFPYALELNAWLFLFVFIYIYV